MDASKFLFRAEVFTEGDPADLEEHFGITTPEEAADFLQRIIEDELFGSAGPREGESVTVEFLGVK